MAAVGADVQATSTELVNLIEELRERRNDVDSSIKREEEEKNKVIGEMKALAERLRLLEDSLKRKYTAREDFDRAINETSTQFARILDTSRNLLSSVKQESVALSKRM